ncbi:MAG: hypothetical protein QOG48_893, partial [Verrucomicrobiota bacterium]
VSVLPYVQVYGRNGKLVGNVEGLDPDGVKRYVAQAKSSAH